MTPGSWNREREMLILNARIIRHELETPMRGHDSDGRCCLRAKLTPLDDESPAQSED